MKPYKDILIPIEAKPERSSKTVKISPKTKQLYISSVLKRMEILIEYTS